MKTKHETVLQFALCSVSALLCCSCFSPVKSGCVTTQGAALPVFEIQVSGSIVFEIDPRIEFLSGVQAHTSWVKGSRDPGTIPDRYNKHLADFFKPYENHPAVRVSKSLTRIGFTYDAPPGFILSTTNGAAMLPPSEGWSEYHSKRAGIFFGRSRLNRFAVELSELYSMSNFEGFLQSHESDYQAWLHAAASSFDWARLTVWMEAFYSQSDLPTLYHFVLAPAMFPGGGYGYFFTEKDALGNDVRRHIYQIIRNSAATSIAAAAGAPPFPSAENLALLGLHEFGHSYVNPVLENLVQSEPYKDAFTSLFTPVAKQMREMAYPSMPVFMNELLIRAITIVGAEDLRLSSPQISEVLISYELDHSFYPVRFVIDTIKELRTKHGNQAVFADWLPELLDALAATASD